jgi:hypothetical protein
MARPILVEILGDAHQFQAELNRATGTTRRFGTAARVAGGLLATGLAFGLEQSVKAAIDAQDSHRRLEQAFKNVGLSATAYEHQVAGAEAASRKLGFAGNEVRDALGSLLTATGSVSLSIKDLGVAQDLARFKGVDLETATQKLTLAMSGSQRAIKSLGANIIPTTAAVDALKASHENLATAAGRADLAQAKLADKMATGQAVIAATSELVKGQGQAYAETAAGGMARFSAETDHLKVIIGDALIPALTFFLTKVSDITAALSQSLGPSVGRVTTQLSRFRGEAEFVGRVLVGVLKIAVFVVKLEIEEFVLALRVAIAVLNGLRSAAGAVAGFFSGVFSGAVSGAHAAVNGLRAGVDGVRTALNAVHTAGSAVASFFRGALTAAFNAFKGVANAIASVINGIASALRAVANAAHAVASALSSIHVPSIHLPHIGLPNIGIPGFQHGTRGFAGGLALVGEAGPELVRLPRGSDVIPNRALGGGPFEIHSHVYLDGKQIMEVVNRQQYRNNRRNGYQQPG